MNDRTEQNQEQCGGKDLGDRKTVVDITLPIDGEDDEQQRQNEDCRAEHTKRPIADPIAYRAKPVCGGIGLQHVLTVAEEIEHEADAENERRDEKDVGEHLMCGLFGTRTVGVCRLLLRGSLFGACGGGVGATLILLLVGVRARGGLLATLFCGRFLCPRLGCGGKPVLKWVKKLKLSLKQEILFLMKL